MKERTVSITKKRNGKNEEVDWELVNKFKRVLEHVKHGRVTEWKPKTK